MIFRIINPFTKQKNLNWIYCVLIFLCFCDKKIKPMNKSEYTNKIIIIKKFIINKVYDTENIKHC